MSFTLRLEFTDENLRRRSVCERRLTDLEFELGDPVTILKFSSEHLLHELIRHLVKERPDLISICDAAPKRDRGT